MKLGLIAETAAKAICEHTKHVVVGIDELTEGLIVENPKTYVPDIGCVNTCLAVRNMLIQPQLQEMFLGELGITGGSPVSLLYGFVGPKGFSDLLEVAYGTRFMSGDVGKSLGFVQGTALPVGKDVFTAFPQLLAIQEALKEIEYCGEITLGCKADFTLGTLRFGHNTGLFALFTELSQLSPQANYEWCLGVGTECKVHAEGVSVCTLLSNPPFPGVATTPSGVIAPSAAEKHLYRMIAGNQEIAYVATWGTTVIEAKRRTRRTIENCASYNPELQYRIDYGYKEKFVLSQDKYIQLGGQ